MKKVLLGILILLIINILNHRVWLETESGTKIHKISWFIESSILQGSYILDPIDGNCKDEMGENGHGWKFNVADYYSCDRFQRALNGNFKKPNPDSVKY